MLVIRFARTGKKKQAYFRIVVAEKQKSVSAKFIEILGNYNPHQKTFSINKEKLEKYLKNGAQPSNTLAKLLKKEGIKMPAWVKIAERNRPSKKKEEPEEAAPKSEVKAEEVEEAPAEGAETAPEKEVAAEEPAKEEVKEEAPAEKAEEDEPKDTEEAKEDAADKK